ncbi:MAG: GSCFA domain-containing protein [Flavobacteriales bacterium]|nr:GSCFA domain-containing protein [Flavobacteriales bacterium]MBL6869609.1 GSCFA domain-containing protein [Flavobacteriales bacterium]
MSLTQNFRTEVNLTSKSKNNNHLDQFLLIGSCFATEMSLFFKKYCFGYLNPYGTIYNPISLAKNFEKLISKDSYMERNLVNNNEVFLSWNHSGKYYSNSSELLLNKINKEQEDTFKMLNSNSNLFITFGTSKLYIHKESNQVVANCHKQMNTIFSTRRATVDEVVDSWRSILKKIDNPVIFTVSPVRHVRDGLVENNLNKSVLLLAIDQLCKEFPENVSYFPSYEILIDELRDYRFYSNDWIHPSEEAKEFIWNKLSDILLSEKTKKLNIEIHKIRTSLAHQPKFGINAEYLSFLNKTLQKIKEIKRNTPFYSWKDEENIINEIIN